MGQGVGQGLHTLYFCLGHCKGISNIDIVRNNQNPI
jgi:hypothetical protein